MRTHGGPLTDREASVILEVIERYRVALVGLMDCALAASRLTLDEAASSLLAAGVDNAAAQVEAMADMMRAAHAESRRERGGA